jgi:hypothetical protein
MMYSLAVVFDSIPRFYRRKERKRKSDLLTLPTSADDYLITSSN